MRCFYPGLRRGELTSQLQKRCPRRSLLELRRTYSLFVFFNHPSSMFLSPTLNHAMYSTAHVNSLSSHIVPDSHIVDPMSDS
jgi:hypothetical protein